MGAETFLERIVAARRAAVAVAAAQVPLAEMRRALRGKGEPVRPFLERLRDAAARDGLAVVAEVKRASPSKGPIRPDLDPVALATAYARGGAAALSVLTEPSFFLARADDLPRARAAGLPVLRKDFVVDRWQLYETALLPADAVLLIAAVLGAEIPDYVELALQLGLEPLVEVHDASELALALRSRARCIGINNRNLRSFEVDPSLARRLAPEAARAGRTVVAESGIAGPADVADLAAAGVTAVLVGESLVRAADPAAALRRLLGAERGTAARVH
jgi:indole-3-glycerol phosphate synthase